MPTELRVTVFETLDHSTPGTRLRVEFQRRINAALLACGLPFIRTITVHNETDADLPPLELAVALAVGSEPAHQIVCREDKGIPAGGLLRFGDERFAEFALPISARRRSAVVATLTVTVRPVPAAEPAPGTTEAGEGGGAEAATDSVLTSLTAAAEIGPFDEFLGRPGAWQSIAVFVQPASPAVAQILQSASEALLEKTGSGSLEGYKSGLVRARLIAAAIYQAMSEANIACVDAPASSLEAVGQKMRTAGQVLAERFGSSLELSATYAACCEAAGLHPLIVITATHAFPAFIAVSELEYSLALGSGKGFEFLGETVIDDGGVIAGLVASKSIIPVELGGIGPGKRSLSFRGATKKASDYVRSLSNELKAAVVLSQCRAANIQPLLGDAPAPEPQAANDGAPAACVEAVPPACLEAPPQDSAASPKAEASAAEPAADTEAVDAAEAAAPEAAADAPLGDKDDAPERIRQWKQSLFDFSLRNPLLDLAQAPMTLDLPVPEGRLGEIVDSLQKGEPPACLGAVESRRLRALQRESDTLEQETGNNHLYLTLGVLVHTEPGSGGKEARSPLFLLPVSLGVGPTAGDISLSLTPERAVHPNLCLLEWLHLCRKLTLDALSDPGIEGLGEAIKAAFGRIRINLLSAQLPYRIEERASLAILEISSFQIWKDLDRNWPILMENPAVRHLVERPEGAFEEPLDAAAFEEEKLILPLAADGAQMSAIAAAMSGKSFILEGAPGTGKTQTIANLIAHAMEAGKRVLFVAGKQAALDAVGQRLAEVGLKDFILEVHGAQVGMQDIRQQLKRSMHATAGNDEATWRAAFDRYGAALAALRDYPERLHAPNAAGFSLWSAHDALARLGEGPGWELDPQLIGEIDVAVMSEALARAANISRQIETGGHEHDPWLLLGLDNVDSLTFTTLTRALENLGAVRQRVRELGRGWSDALGELKPGKYFAALNECIAANRQGLLPSKAYFRDIDRMAWRNATHALRQKLEFFLESNREALEIFAPGLIDSPLLNDWTIRATELAHAHFFAEARRKSLREAVEPLVRPGTDLSGAHLLAVLQRAQSVRAQVSELRTHAIAIVGLILPANWAAHRFRALEEFDAAVHLSLTAVWLERHAPAAWLKAQGPKSAPETETLKEMEAAWSRWLAIVGATERSIDQWLGGRAWLRAWDEDAPRWEDDLAGTGLLQLQRHAWLRKELQAIDRAGGGDFADKLAHKAFPLEDAAVVIQRGLAAASLRERLATLGLDRFDEAAQDQALLAFQDSAREARRLAALAGPAHLLARRPFRANNVLGEVTALVRQVERRRGGMSLREISARYPEALLTFAPVFLMSPGSVAHFLDAGSLKFDIVIFDEASRIRTPEAIGAMGRGASVVIVGDTRQLPPARPADAAVGVPKSILGEALEAGLPRLRLAWHYRSLNETLFAFSNTRYYGGELASLPGARREPGLGLLLRRIHGKHLRDKEQREQTNPVEARAVLDEIAARLRDPARQGQTLGVICFSAPQRELILDMLEASAEPAIQAALAAPAGQRLFVKTPDSAQGEERDIILLSLVFSPESAKGANIALPPETGREWLNVALTRARRQVVLFASFGPEHIHIEPGQEGASALGDLKDYLAFVAAGVPERERESGPPKECGVFAGEIVAALEARGYIVGVDVGRSAFRVDLAVKRPGDKGWRLAVMLDGPDWKSRPTVTDRDAAPFLLGERQGWPGVARVWLPAWLRDRDAQIARLTGLLNSDG